MVVYFSNIFRNFGRMPDKCVVPGCTTFYDSNSEKVSGFYFPLYGKNSKLVEYWVKFVNRGDGWKPTKYSRVCSKHFEGKFMKQHGKKTTLIWKLDPVPSIPAKCIEENASSTLYQGSNRPRKDPCERVFQPDELTKFKQIDEIKNFSDLNEKMCPQNWTFEKHNGYCVFYNLEIVNNLFPKVFECINVDEDLHVKLFFNGNPVPLPLWFIIITRQS